MPSAPSPAARSPSPVLVAEDVRKSYGRRPALRGLSFSLEAGRILGFLGPNGAGKTTAIRILTTILEPDAGRFVVAGIRSEDPGNIRRRIGVLPESLGFPKHLTGVEFLTYFGQLYGRTAPHARTYGRALLQEMGLDQRARSLIGAYSRGMRQRLGIARALVNDPAVLFLDEPTLGLDPRGQQELLALVRRIARERSVGIILCSHALSEVEAVCDDVVILSVGRVVARGTVADVVGQAQRSVTERGGLRIHVPPSSLAAAQRVLAALPVVREVTPIGEMTGGLRVELVEEANGHAAEEPHINNRILEALLRAGIPILSVEIEGGRLRDVFLHLTEEAVP